MNILITGSTGFIGKNLIHKLREKHQVHILVRSHSTNFIEYAQNVFIFNNNIDDLTAYLNNNYIDGIIHLASLYISEHKSDQILDLILSNIYLGTAVLEACSKSSVKWFLNTGTIWQNYQAPELSDIYNPVNLYAATKQAFIDMARYYIETTSLRFCTLKLCDTYGVGDTRRKLLALFSDLTKSKNTLEMTNGFQKIDLLYIDDVICGFMKLAIMLNDKTIPLKNEYVLSSGKFITLRQLASTYEKIKNVKLNIDWGKYPYRRREVMIPYKGNVLIDWEPQISLEKGIQLLS